RINFVAVGGNAGQAVRDDDAVEQIERQAFQRTYFSHVTTSLGVRPDGAWMCCRVIRPCLQGQRDPTVCGAHLDQRRVKATGPIMPFCRACRSDRPGAYNESWILI